MDIKEKLKKVSKLFSTNENELKEKIVKTLESKYEDSEVRENVLNAIISESKRIMEYKERKAIEKVIKQKRKRDISKANRKKALKSRRK